MGETVGVARREPLRESDFAYVISDVGDQERKDLMALISENRDCFAKDLAELDCTQKITVDILEMPGSALVACRPYTTSALDREEIARIVADWKSHGIVKDTVFPYASPVLLVK